ncbi:hypothetical protein Q9189_005663 [Teloschistes chrysophthalmus]
MAYPEERTRLSKHFDGPESSYKDRWADLWDAGDFLPWDRGGPNPALIDLLDQRKDLLGDCFNQEDAGVRRRKRALVPGCGRGYDVLLLASRGYDAYGLEVSAKATQGCLEEKAANGHKYSAKNESAGAGKSTFLTGDFFQSKWASDVGGVESFDLIYDYTFLCALRPTMRPAWAQQMSRLLTKNPSGRLICLEFPSYKDPLIGGPPFGLTPSTYVEHLGHPGVELPYDSKGHVKEGSRDQVDPDGLQRLDHWQPQRTHEVGQGTDWVSVWSHQ